MEIQTIISMDTVLNADCIDFCPISPYQHLFVVGTYQYEKKEEESRFGKLYLLKEQDSILTKLDQKEMPGILDIRWCNHKIQEKIILGLVNAEGMFIIYSLDENKMCLNEINKVKVCSDISLYFDWSTRLKINSTPSISVSDSKGFVTLYSCNERDIDEVHKFKAHHYEAWVTTFNYWNPYIIYSGGDDCKFLSFDIRSNQKVFEIDSHTAGVTSIQSCLWKEEVLFSGCYNGDLNIWDSRNLKSPIFNINLEGGVWRLRSEPYHKPLIVASCMHNGFKLLEFDLENKPTVIGNYLEHKSLAYGADWSWVKRENESKYRIGSVSFYDHLMCLWDFNY